MDQGKVNYYIALLRIITEAKPVISGRGEGRNTNTGSCPFTGGREKEG